MFRQIKKETKLLETRGNHLKMYLVVCVWWITSNLSLIHGSDDMYSLTQAQLLVGALLGLLLPNIEVRIDLNLFLLSSACFAGSTLASNLSLGALPLTTYSHLKCVDTGILFLVTRWKTQTLMGLLASILTCTYFYPPVALSLVATLGNVIVLYTNQTASKGFAGLWLYSATCLVGGVILGSFLVCLNAVNLFLLHPLTEISILGWRSACFFTIANICAFQLHRFPDLYALANLGRRIVSVLLSFKVGKL